MTTYRIYTDGIFGGIVASEEDADGFEVFSTFTAAKAALVKDLMGKADEYRQSAAYCRTLKLKDVEDDRPFNKWEQDYAEG